jgi:hypothetical protein
MVGAPCRDEEEKQGPVEVCSTKVSSLHPWLRYGRSKWQVYTGPVKAGNYGSKDFLQAQDLTTGETEYFRFQFL